MTTGSCEELPEAVREVSGILSTSDQAEFDTAAESDDDPCDVEEELLQAARTGNAAKIVKLIQQNTGLNVNCKGRHRWNNEWTPLHLAAYFGHINAVKALLENGADPSITNGDGDTPLHKAALTGREPLVMLLLTHGVDVSVVNAEGSSAYDLASEIYLKNVLTAAELADKKRREGLFFQAVKDGNVAAINELLSSQPAFLKADDYDMNDVPDKNSTRNRRARTASLDVNCVDAVGNTALHAAAFRDFPAVAVTLLQCGADPNRKNRRGLTPIDLARSEQMKRVLKVRPIQEIKDSVVRFEGALLRKRRFRKPQPVWAVADRGVLALFGSRADASTGTRRKCFYYLDRCVIVADPRNECAFTLMSAKGASERFSTVDELERSRWFQALKQHSSFVPLHSPSSATSAASADGEGERILPFGCIQDALVTAQAQQALLTSEVSKAGALHTSFMKTALEEGECSVRAQNASHFLREQLSRVVGSSMNVLSCVESCILLMKQHNEATTALMAQKTEEARLLRETLMALEAFSADSLSLSEVEVNNITARSGKLPKKFNTLSASSPSVYEQP